MLLQSFESLEVKVLDQDSALELLIFFVENNRIQAELEQAKG
ncbi:MAG: hypothetical protein O4861_07680 [Trichodesmium sp. St16_bin4-tuft]|nr:hypothetical protein [Trichodesmium sp. St4_bin8_1]MDE5074269.1 hypothetical protein [Trichodesmium sp. St5_bin8]MDE5077285.1 hypothetical protein [Trichodesmium sp. St2_bin6]MDE5098219.1 hypothetical protein [Trichodesmium sp. St16_bin4-tuft]MDE5101619.1 hypothetical protein [Trichodesmium sp. St19_bin2]